MFKNISIYWSVFTLIWKGFSWDNAWLHTHIQLDKQDMAERRRLLQTETNFYVLDHEILGHCNDTERRTEEVATCVQLEGTNPPQYAKNYYGVLAPVWRQTYEFIMKFRGQNKNLTSEVLKIMYYEAYKFVGSQFITFEQQKYAVRKALLEVLINEDDTHEINALFEYLIQKPKL
jgi:hypothetical protein